MESSIHLYGGRILINIAIVDNEKSVLENIREILLNLSGEFKDVHIDTYEKAENLPGNRERTDTDSGNICERSGQNVQRRAKKDRKT